MLIEPDTDSLSAIYKNCSRCKVWKPKSSFSKNAGFAEGLYCYCKDCKSKVKLADYLVKMNDLEYVRERNLKQQDYKLRNKDKIKARDKIDRLRNPEKKAARQAVRHALRSGELIKKDCEVCGETKVQAHHDNYSKPLNVRWLCKRCHINHHLKYERKSI